ncbi:MAG TPA: hypothetical protein VGJ93_00130 [Desulfuromonadaceae bacterium]|jgi:hypothetical protein
MLVQLRKVVVMLIISLCATSALADNQFKKSGREIGQGFKHFGEAAGKFTKDSGKAIGKGFKKAGQDTGKAMKQVGKDIRDAFKRGGKGND